MRGSGRNLIQETRTTEKTGNMGREGREGEGERGGRGVGRRTGEIRTSETGKEERRAIKEMP